MGWRQGIPVWPFSVCYEMGCLHTIVTALYSIDLAMERKTCDALWAIRRRRVPASSCGVLWLLLYIFRNSLVMELAIQMKFICVKKNYNGKKICFQQYPSPSRVLIWWVSSVTDRETEMLICHSLWLLLGYGAERSKEHRLDEIPLSPKTGTPMREEREVEVMDDAS